MEDILQAARDRERRGQRLALEIDAKFQLQDTGAVQFQLASAILGQGGCLRVARFHCLFIVMSCP